MAISCGKEGNSKDKYIPQQVQPQSQPPLNGYGHIISPVFEIQPSLCVFDSSVLMDKVEKKGDKLKKKK